MTDSRAIRNLAIVAALVALAIATIRLGTTSPLLSGLLSNLPAGLIVVVLGIPIALALNRDIERRQRSREREQRAKAERERRRAILGLLGDELAANEHYLRARIDEVQMPPGGTRPRRQIMLPGMEDQFGRSLLSSGDLRYIDPRLLSVVGRAYEMIAHEKRLEAVYYENIRFIGLRTADASDLNLVAVDPAALAAVNDALQSVRDNSD
jgi:hypothetical protein